MFSYEPNEIPSHGAGVLLADDDALLRGLIAIHLQRLGITVEEASSEVELMGRLRRGPVPRALVLDVNMPAGAGFRTLEWIRANPATRAMPVIMATGCKSRQDVEAAITLGANSYLIKPFKPFRLIQVLRQCTTMTLPLEHC